MAERVHVRVPVEGVCQWRVHVRWPVEGVGEAARVGFMYVCVWWKCACTSASMSGTEGCVGVLQYGMVVGVAVWHYRHCSVGLQALQDGTVSFAF